MQDYEIAKEILNQLGGHRFIQATKAEYYFAPEAPQLRIVLPESGFRGINRIDIGLSPMDDYCVHFIAMESRNGEFVADAVKEYDNVYCDELLDMICAEAGLSLPYELHIEQDGPRLVPSSTRTLFDMFSWATQVMNPLKTPTFLTKEGSLVWTDTNFVYPNIKFLIKESQGIFVKIARYGEDHFKVSFEKAWKQDGLWVHICDLSLSSSCKTAEVCPFILKATGVDLLDKSPGRKYSVTWGDPVIRMPRTLSKTQEEWARAFLDGQAIHAPAFLTLMGKTYLDPSCYTHFCWQVRCIKRDGTYTTVEDGVNIPILEDMGPRVAEDLESMLSKHIDIDD